jgi:hypothetical protein
MDSRSNVTVPRLRESRPAGRPAGLAAASIWAAGLPQDQGNMVDAQTWQTKWPPRPRRLAARRLGTGWWPASAASKSAAPRRADRTLVPADAVFLRLTGPS